MTQPALEDPEDNKLVVLARSTRGRTGAAEAAALRDLDGRTYAAARVELPSLTVSAVGVCVAMALSSGSRGAEAVVVLAGAGGAIDETDLAVVREFAGEGVPVHRVTPSGRAEETRRS